MNPDPSKCVRCGAERDPERMGDLCDGCIEKDRRANAKVINALHPGNRFRLMGNLPFLPEDPFMRPAAAYRWKHEPGDPTCECLFPGIWSAYPYECTTCKRLLPEVTGGARYFRAMLEHRRYLLAQMTPLQLAGLIARHYVSLAQTALTLTRTIQSLKPDKEEPNPEVMGVISHLLKLIQTTHAHDFGLELNWTAYEEAGAQPLRPQHQPAGGEGSGRDPDQAPGGPRHDGGESGDH